MKSARSATTALGAVASAAIVSSGMAGGLLGAASPAEAAITAAVPYICGSPPAAARAARNVPAGQTAVSLDAAFRPASTPKATASATSSQSSSAAPNVSASSSATAKATASSTASAKATTSAPATPSGSASASPSKSASASPSSTADPTPTPSPTSGSGSATPTPTPTPTPTKAQVQLCLEVQPITTKSSLHPGDSARYAIWVWPAGGAASGVSVTVSAQVAGKSATPTFTVCPSASGRTCTVGGIAKGASDELQAKVPVPSSAAAGKQATLSSTAKSSDASAPVPASGAVTITAKPAASSSASPTPTPTTTTTPTGVGATLPAGILPTVPGVTDPQATLPELPNPESSPGGLFPTVSPGPTASPSPYSATLPNARDVRVTDAAASFPFSTRLVGGEIVGLAILAAAIAIAIVRFSLRRPRPQHGKDGS
jgi:hypothetical protein